MKQASFPFWSILALIFITLKLIGTISWSWWWVLAPVWGPAAFVLAFMAVMGVGAVTWGR